MKFFLTSQVMNFKESYLTESFEFNQFLFSKYYSRAFHLRVNSFPIHIYTRKVEFQFSPIFPILKFFTFIEKLISFNYNFFIPKYIVYER